MLLWRYRNNPTRLKEEIREVNKLCLKNDIVKNDGDISSRCFVCNIVVHRASYAKLWRKMKLLEHEKQFEMIIPEWLLQDIIENKPCKNIIIHQ